MRLEVEVRKKVYPNVPEVGIGGEDLVHDLGGGEGGGGGGSKLVTG